MRKFLIGTVAGIMAAAMPGGLVSCKKRADAVASDLGEAGYEMTAEDWFRASRENNVEAMKKFIAGKFGTDTRDGAGDTALHVAAGAGAQDAVDFLLNRGLSVDLRGAMGRTPLMAAVIGDQTPMVRWLLRQGANPAIRDDGGFLALMLAVREGRPGSVAELATYHRGELDSALLLAALVGGHEVIDTLTNYGASVYARMDDGRTPLMVAAENGHLEAVKLLIDIGSSRFSTDAEGKGAADLAEAAGHPEIAAWIHREPQPDEFALESPEQVALAMTGFVDAAAAEDADEALDATHPGAVGDDGEAPGSTVSAGRQAAPAPAIPIAGETLSQPVVRTMPATGGTSPPASTASATAPAEAEFALPPLVMRHYREREVPIEIRTVREDTVTLHIPGATPREVTVREGAKIPGSRLTVVSVRRRMEDSKLNLGELMEVSAVQVRDETSGTTREWISGVPASGHDPVALLEDSATGRRYTAAPGQRFRAADGSEFIVSDVRPNQVVIEDAATGAVQTLPLSGPRG
jgi:hypothetical protein